VISDDTQADVISPNVKSILPGINHFLAENVRTARRFLSSLKIYPSIETLSFQVLNKDTNEKDLPQLMQPLREGLDVGVISESGCPGVADPGALAAAWAHQNGFEVIPLVGPSSILLALMASGLNGQQFTFHGYLPIEAKAAGDQLRLMEKESKKRSQTQIFIETPYRNNQIFELLLKTLHKDTLLTVAVDITGKEQSIRTQSIGKWLSAKTTWPKTPAVFLFLSNA
jgi:16S rRNA (cytidine1402-2'-O)-methyltransferase